MVGQPAGGSLGPFFPPREPGRRGIRLPPDRTIPHLDVQRSVEEPGHLRSYDSAVNAQNTELHLSKAFNESGKRSVVYFCSLLMQSLSQVFNALVHHGHLGVPLVKQLFVLGQFVALLQVLTITSLRSPINKGIKNWGAKAP